MRSIPFIADRVPRPTQRTVRRIFEPIPRPVTYGAGLVLALLILAPFWLYLIQDRFGAPPILISEDIEQIPVPPITTTNAYTPVLEENLGPSGLLLNQYRGIRLNASREDFQRRFNLRLQNTRGMVPEIYEAAPFADVEKASMHFYNNTLKEIFFYLNEKQATPDDVEKDLRDLFGEPRTRKEREEGPIVSAKGLNPLGGLSAAKPKYDIDKRLAAIPFQRELTWYDKENRADATIFYTSQNPTQCVSVLVLHISAERWLEDNRPRLGSFVAPTPTNLLEKVEDHPAPERPKRLFP